jgi:hypothetical protein
VRPAKRLLNIQINRRGDSSHDVSFDNAKYYVLPRSNPCVWSCIHPQHLLMLPSSFGLYIMSTVGFPSDIAISTNYMMEELIS